MAPLCELAVALDPRFSFKRRMARGTKMRAREPLVVDVLSLRRGKFNTETTNNNLYLCFSDPQLPIPAAGNLLFPRPTSSFPA